MRVVLSLGVALAAIVAVGCSGEAEQKMPKFNTGALVRLVNMTKSPVHVKFGVSGSADCNSWDRTTFIRCPPKKLDVEVTMNGKSEKVPVDLQPKGQYTVYAVESGGKVEYTTITDEPKDAGAGKVMFRAISFAGQDVDVTIKPVSGDALEAKALKKGTPSSVMSSSPQSFTVTVSVGGKPIGEEKIEAKDGETYTVGVSEDGKPMMKVFLNNQKMLATPGGASPA
jgi:hypothetical protein